MFVTISYWESMLLFFIFGWIWNYSNSSQIIQHRLLYFIMVVFRWTSGIFLPIFHIFKVLYFAATTGPSQINWEPIFIYLFFIQFSYYRGNWEISRRDLQNPRFIAMVTTDHEYMNNDFDDDYSAPSSRSLLCCRIVAITVTLLLSLSLSHQGEQKINQIDAEIVMFYY